jgi:hypothetical protein
MKLLSSFLFVPALLLSAVSYGSSHSQIKGATCIGEGLEVVVEVHLEGARKNSNAVISRIRAADDVSDNIDFLASYELTVHQPSAETEGYFIAFGLNQKKDSPFVFHVQDAAKDQKKHVGSVGARLRSGKRISIDNLDCELSYFD